MRALFSIIGVGLLAGACTAAGATASPGSIASPSPTADAKYHVRTDAGSLILEITSEGGFTSPASQLTRLPMWALYGDGRILVPGPVVQTFPAPLLPNVRQMQVTPAEIQKIMAAADVAGLLGADGTFNVVGNPDAGTTVFRANVDGRTHIVSANSLGGDTAGSGLDPAVAAARTKLAAFEASMQDLSTFLGRPVTDTSAYTPTAMRLYLSAAGPADPSAPAPQNLAWPLSSDPATLGRPAIVEGELCVALTGGDLAAFVKAAGTAASTTVWTAPSGAYTIQARPLYPDESGC